MEVARSVAEHVMAAVTHHGVQTSSVLNPHRFLTVSAHLRSLSREDKSDDLVLEPSSKMDSPDYCCRGNTLA